MDNLERYLKIFEHCGHCDNAKQLVEFFNNYGQKYKNSYFNSSFDNDGKNGIVVIKYSKCPMTENTSNEQLSKAPLNFIITVEGFNADGSIKSPLKVETINYYDANKKARKIPVTGFEGLKATKDYLISYFEKYDRELMNEDGEGGGGDAGGGDAGAGTSTADVAIFRQRMPMGTIKIRKKNKK